MKNLGLFTYFTTMNLVISCQWFTFLHHPVYHQFSQPVITSMTYTQSKMAPPWNEWSPISILTKLRLTCWHIQLWYRYAK